MDMWCHSECLVQKVAEVKELSWNNVVLEDLVGRTEYPENEDVFMRKLHHEEMKEGCELIEDNSIVGCLDSVKDEDSTILLEGWFLGKKKELIVSITPLRVAKSSDSSNDISGE